MSETPRERARSFHVELRTSRLGVDAAGLQVRASQEEELLARAAH